MFRSGICGQHRYPKIKRFVNFIYNIIELFELLVRRLHVRLLDSESVTKIFKLSINGLTVRSMEYVFMNEKKVLVFFSKSYQI